MSGKLFTVRFRGRDGVHRIVANASEGLRDRILAADPRASSLEGLERLSAENIATLARVTGLQCGEVDEADL